MIKGGTAGMYLIVISLSWWVAEASVGDKQLWEAVNDVAWVLSQVNALLAKLLSASGPPKTSPAGTAATSMKCVRPTLEAPQINRPRKRYDYAPCFCSR